MRGLNSTSLLRDSINGVPAFLAHSSKKSAAKWAALGGGASGHGRSCLADRRGVEEGSNDLRTDGLNTLQ